VNGESLVSYLETMGPSGYFPESVRRLNASDSSSPLPRSSALVVSRVSSTGTGVPSLPICSGPSLSSRGLAPLCVRKWEGEGHGGTRVALERERPLQLVGQGSDQLEA
jgi:hypothetical protein